MVTYAITQMGHPVYGPAGAGGVTGPRLIMSGTMMTLPDGITVYPVNTADLTGDPGTIGDPGVVIPQPAMDIRLAALRKDIFGCTPARVNSEEVINYGTKEGMAVYREATKSLYRDSEKQFDLSSGGLHGFLGKLNHRTRLSGWHLMSVNTAAAGAAVKFRSLLTHFGEITFENVQAAVAVHDDTTTLAVQHDEQIFSCIMGSLSINAINIIDLKIHEYVAVSGENSGILLLFLVIQESTLQTKSTMNSLWGKLTAGLPSIMNAHANNIVAFNTEVREIQRQLRARGQDASDIIPQLFSVYSGCEGEETAFSRFMEYMENDYSNGNFVDAEHLMFKAEEKYKELKERQKYTTGKDKPSDLVALQTKFEELAKKVKNQKTTGGSDGKQEKTTAPRDDSKNQWMYKKPTGNEPTTKTVNEKEYHWCNGNGAHKPKWVRHKPSECRGNESGTSTGEESKDEEPNGGSGAGGWSAAMQATLSDLDE